MNKNNPGHKMIILNQFVDVTALQKQCTGTTTSEYKRPQISFKLFLSLFVGGANLLFH
jgi:hypothetical protein